MKAPLLCTALLTTTNINAQSYAEILINGNKKAATSVYSVKEDDKIEINIYLNNNINKDDFIKTIQARTCNPTQQQQQQQEAKDKIDILFNEIQNSFSKKYQFGYKPIPVNQQEYKLQITFTPKDLTSCKNRYFWLEFKVNPLYIQKTREIQNFQSKYKFILL
jgi:hypothetical protein